jgi:hypothetical protein
VDPDIEVREICGWALHHARLVLPIEDLFRYLVRLGPAKWPSLRTLNPEPSKLSFFMGPADGRFEPFQCAPLFRPQGGVVYFGGEPTEKELHSLLSTLDVQVPNSSTSLVLCPMRTGDSSAINKHCGEQASAIHALLMDPSAVTASTPARHSPSV